MDVSPGIAIERIDINDIEYSGILDHVINSTPQWHTYRYRPLDKKKVRR